MLLSYHLAQVSVSQLQRTTSIYQNVLWHLWLHRNLFVQRKSNGNNMWVIKLCGRTKCKLTKSTKICLVSILADIGGIFGCFLGGSIISIVEMLVFSALTFWDSVKVTINYFKKWNQVLQSIWSGASAHLGKNVKYETIPIKN